MDIGEKLKKARKDASYTQEQISELLGISRQTISSWENNKSYPDIISLIKLSDTYQVSLDYLIKGEQPMNEYVDYLNESTNIVKSKNKMSKLIISIFYLGISFLSVIVFLVLFNSGNKDEMSSMFFYAYYLCFKVALPVVGLIISFIVGRNNYWGRLKWLYSIYLVGIYLLSIIAMSYFLSTLEGESFELNNLIVFLPIFAIRFLIALIIGMGVGYLIYKYSKKA
ncbi:Transcriptional regulator, XRE family [Lachnospiraceae bacterium TWA4]|nr:Transcriptional regulator, XRE family [Lachnospiraceae bacterium TWA4]